MNPRTKLKVLAEIVRASSPQGSFVNDLAGGAKASLTFLDGLTADTPAKRSHALASLISEIAYANSASDKERIGLTFGNFILLLLENAQYVNSTSQPVENRGAVDPSCFQAYQQQSAQFSREFQQIMCAQEELQRQHQKQQQANMLRLQQEYEALRQENASLRRK